MPTFHPYTGALSAQQSYAPDRSDASVQAHAGRLPWLDVLRVLAIGDIVALHTSVPYPRPFAGIGLPVFLFCTIALAAKRVPPHPWRVNLAKRTRRLLIPWLLWSAFYGLVNTFRAWRSGNPRFGDLLDPSWSMLWMGTEIVLWYLPFAFLAEIIVNPVMHAGNRLHISRPNPSIAGWLVGGVVLLAAVPVLYGDKAMPPIMNNYFKSMLLLPLGIGVGLLLHHHHKGLAATITLVGCGLALLAAHAFGIEAARFGSGQMLPDWLWQSGIALALIGMAIALQSRPPRWLAWLATLTFPVYLLHIFVAWPVSRVIDRTLGEVHPALFWLAVWSATIAAAALVKRIPFVRKYC